MSDEFKWQAVGAHQVIADERDGRILAYIVYSDRQPIAAFLDDRHIGSYLTEQQARNAVENRIRWVRKLATKDEWWEVLYETAKQ